MSHLIGQTRLLGVSASALRLRERQGDHERYRLRRAGDALTFPSTLPHRWRNDAGGETRLLWINTPPTF